MFVCSFVDYSQSDFCVTASKSKLNFHIFYALRIKFGSGEKDTKKAIFVVVVVVLCWHRICCFWFRSFFREPLRRTEFIFMHH